MRVFGAGLVAVAIPVVAVLAGMSVPAAAAPRSISGAANLGSVTGHYYEERFNSGKLSRCTVPGHAHLNPRRFGDVAMFGAGDSTCTYDSGVVITRAAGTSVSLTYAQDFDSRPISFTNFAARCTATAHSAVPRINAGTVRLNDRVILPNHAKTLPRPIPKNYKILIEQPPPPGPTPDDTLVLNEQVPNGRGGVTVSVAHYRTYDGSDIYVGRADCAPLG